MKTITMTALAVALLSTGLPASAADSMKLMKKDRMSMSKDMKAMDTNGDGMISKEEYMKHSEMMFEGMQKNKDGMIDMKHMSMTKGGSMMKSEPMMKGDAMKADKPMTKAGITTGQKAPN